MGELLKNSLPTGPVGELGSVPFTQWESWGECRSLNGRTWGEYRSLNGRTWGEYRSLSRRTWKRAVHLVGELGGVPFIQWENLGVCCSLSGS